MAILSRPSWQFYLHDLHIFTLPKFLMIKSVFQVFIVVLSKTVGKTNYRAHVFLYFFSFVIYLLLNKRIKAFNYGVLWAWHVTSIFCVIWLEFLIILNMMTSENFAYVILLFTGWFLVLVTAFVVIKKSFPSYIIGQTNPHLDKLYMFNFRFWVHRSEFVEQSMFVSENIYRNSDLDCHADRAENEDN
jgi:hypothetical protein